MTDNPPFRPAAGASRAADAALGRPLSLADLPLGIPARVTGMRTFADSREALELNLRLLEIGFIEGEAVRVIAQGHPGR